jgi:hypothetical protein
MPLAPVAKEDLEEEGHQVEQMVNDNLQAFQAGDPIWDDAVQQQNQNLGWPQWPQQIDPPTESLSTPT